MMSPIVSYEIVANNIRPLTPFDQETLAYIFKYCSNLFESPTAMMEYGIRQIDDTGVEIFIQELTKEIISTKRDGDIMWNQEKRPEFERSLRMYLNYLYLEYPPNIQVEINGNLLDLKNPYQKIYQVTPQQQQNINALK